MTRSRGSKRGCNNRWVLFLLMPASRWLAGSFAGTGQHSACYLQDHLALCTNVRLFSVKRKVLRPAAPAVQVKLLEDRLQAAVAEQSQVLERWESEAAEVG